MKCEKCHHEIHIGRCFVVTNMTQCKCKVRHTDELTFDRDENAAGKYTLNSMLRKYGKVIIRRSD